MSKLSENWINKINGPQFLNFYYGILFPAYLIGLIMGFIFGNNVLGALLGNVGDIINGGFPGQYRFIINSSLAIAFLIPFLTILASMNKMSQEKMNYSPILGRKSKLFTLYLTFMGVGLYLLFQFIFTQSLVSIFGQQTIFLFNSNQFSIDSFTISVYTQIKPATNLIGERIIIFISFILSYIAVEILLRGVLLNYSRINKLGLGVSILVVAIIQAISFVNIMGIFSPSAWGSVSLVFVLNFTYGIIAGFILLKTKNFWSVLLFAVLVPLLQPNSLFQDVSKELLTLFVDSYIPFLSSGAFFTSQTFTFLNFLGIALLILSPVSLILGYQDTIEFFKSAYIGIRREYKSLFLIILAFFVIALIFSLINSATSSIVSTSIIGLVLGFIIAIVILRFVLPILFKYFPDPDPLIQLTIKEETFNLNHLYPLVVKPDLDYLEESKLLTVKSNRFSNPRMFGLIFGLLYLYLLFIYAVYRQIEQLTSLNVLYYILLFVVGPAVAFSFAFFFMRRAQLYGYFFSRSWRPRVISSLYLLGISMFYIIGSQAAISHFSWRTLPLFLPFLLVVFPEDLEEIDSDYAVGIGYKGRKETFRWVIFRSQDQFSKIYKELENHPHEMVKLGSILLSSKLEYYTDEELLNKLKEEKLTEGSICGLVIGLGLKHYKFSEGTIRDLLSHPNIQVKISALWALGELESINSLNRMVTTIEEHPYKDLVKIGIKSILKIDPNYPLAGVRDSLTINI